MCACMLYNVYVNMNVLTKTVFLVNIMTQSALRNHVTCEFRIKKPNPY